MKKKYLSETVFFHDFTFLVFLQRFELACENIYGFNTFKHICVQQNIIKSSLSHICFNTFLRYISFN
jgi:hypothetical protein